MNSSLIVNYKINLNDAVTNSFFQEWKKLRSSVPHYMNELKEGDMYLPNAYTDLEDFRIDVKYMHGFKSYPKEYIIIALKLASAMIEARPTLTYNNIHHLFEFVVVLIDKAEKYGQKNIIPIIDDWYFEELAIASTNNEYERWLASFSDNEEEALGKKPVVKMLESYGACRDRYFMAYLIAKMVCPEKIQDNSSMKRMKKLIYNVNNHTIDLDNPDIETLQTIKNVSGILLSDILNGFKINRKRIYKIADLHNEGYKYLSQLEKDINKIIERKNNEKYDTFADLMDTIKLKELYARFKQ